MCTRHCMHGACTVVHATANGLLPIVLTKMWQNLCTPLHAMCMYCADATATRVLALGLTETQRVCTKYVHHCMQCVCTVHTLLPLDCILLDFSDLASMYVHHCMQCVCTVHMLLPLRFFLFALAWLKRVPKA